MKKNRMMRSASALLVMVLMTTSVISGTFAKYVTTNKAEDTARVAKWGVTVDASGNLFGQNYLNGTVNTPTVKTAADEISVAVGDTSTDKLVAPGTQSDAAGLTFSINGKPEVDTKVSMKVEAKDIYLAEGKYGVMQQVTVNETNYKKLFDEGLYTYDSGAYEKVTSATYSSGTYFQLAYETTVDSNGYYPVVYSWDGDSNAKKAVDIAYGIAKKIKTGLVEDSATHVTYTVDNTYNANIELSSLGLDSETITWAWAFGEAEDPADIGEPITDTKDALDTILGDLMADGNGYKVVSEESGTYKDLTVTDKIVTNVAGTEVGCLETKFDIKITVEQVD